MRWLILKVTHLDLKEIVRGNIKNERKITDTGLRGEKNVGAHGNEKQKKTTKNFLFKSTLPEWKKINLELDQCRVVADLRRTIAVLWLIYVELIFDERSC